MWIVKTGEGQIVLEPTFVLLSHQILLFGALHSRAPPSSISVSSSSLLANGRLRLGTSGLVFLVRRDIWSLTAGDAGSRLAFS